MSQMDLIKEYFKEHPNRDIKHPEVVDWATKEWQKRTGEVFRDPDRAIRSLYGRGFLQKISKGVYRYDPDSVNNKKNQDFTAKQKRAIFKRDGRKCAVCGKTEADGVELHIDHIKSVDKGGKAELTNGQVLCSEHNFKKKNYNQTETAKQLFINLHKRAKAKKDKKLQQFTANVLRVYEEHDINGHIPWNDDE